MNPYIGPWQEKMLLKMLRSKKGAFYLLMDLKGNAKRYRSRYQFHLENVIDKYNDSLVMKDSISNNFKILIGPYGSKGGRGFRVVPKVFL